MAIIPNISSDIAGPLGAIHLPRLWSKLRLSAAGEPARRLPGMRRRLRSDGPRRPQH